MQLHIRSPSLECLPYYILLDRVPISKESRKTVRNLIITTFLLKCNNYVPDIMRLIGDLFPDEILILKYIYYLKVSFKNKFLQLFAKTMCKYFGGAVCLLIPRVSI